MFLPRVPESDLFGSARECPNQDMTGRGVEGDDILQSRQGGDLSLSNKGDVSKRLCDVGIYWVWSTLEFRGWDRVCPYF